MLRLILCAVASVVLAVPAHAAAKPNVVFFLVDDLGQRDLGCYGSTFYETPNVDRLATQGARFTDAYAACPVCSPTRASILTGKYPARTGVTDYIGAAQPTKWGRNTPQIPAPYAEKLDLAETTLAEAMKAGGYATFFAGKWHLGPKGNWPEDQGFDVNMGGNQGGGPYGGKKYFSPYGNPSLKDGPPGEHLPDRLATEANKFIEAHKATPFLVYFSFYSVHTPLMSRPDLQKKYEAKAEKLGLKAEFGDEPPRKVRLVQQHAVYAGMVEAMDLAVGKVLGKLDELGLAENTIVVFTSDNGGLSTSEGSPTSNLPLRAGKGWLYEGGIREALVVRWPGKVKPGAVIATPVTSPDFLPTLLDATSLPALAKTDGISLVPLLTKGVEPAERPLFWHYPHYGNQGGAPGAAVRMGDWKLIEWFGDERLELFNLKDDIGEKTNVADKHPDTVAKLRDLIRAWEKDTGAVRSTPNPNYNAQKKNGRG